MKLKLTTQTTPKINNYQINNNKRPTNDSKEALFVVYGQELYSLKFAV